MKFIGSIKQWKELLASIGVEGEWQDDGNMFSIRDVTRAKIIWWKSTGTYQVQGEFLAIKPMSAKIAAGIKDLHARQTLCNESNRRAEAQPAAKTDQQKAKPNSDENAESDWYHFEVKFRKVRPLG